MKLTSDSGCLIANEKSNQSAYGRDRGVAGRDVQLAAHLVQRRDALAAATRQVEHGEVERQSEQPVAHRFGHELVDLVADLPRAALEDRAGGLRGR